MVPLLLPPLLLQLELGTSSTAATGTWWEQALLGKAEDPHHCRRDTKEILSNWYQQKMKMIMMMRSSSQEDMLIAVLILVHLWNTVAGVVLGNALRRRGTLELILAAHQSLGTATPGFEMMLFNLTTNKQFDIL